MLVLNVVVCANAKKCYGGVENRSLNSKGHIFGIKEACGAFVRIEFKV